MIFSKPIFYKLFFTYSSCNKIRKRDTINSDPPAINIKVSLLLLDRHLSRSPVPVKVAAISSRIPPYTYNGEAKGIKAAEKKDEEGWLRQWERETEDWKALVGETSAGEKRIRQRGFVSARAKGGGRGGVSGTPARIPSRLGEPGSLFSRYKFLQLRLVVVMLLTRTRRELLKRRTIGAYTPAASLSRASRATSLRHRRRSPLHHRRRFVVARFFSPASFINPGMRISL